MYFILGRHFDLSEVTDTPQLRQALTAAQSNGQDDVIVLADGIYSTSADGLGPFQFLDDESFSLSLVAENKGQLAAPNARWRAGRSSTGSGLNRDQTSIEIDRFGYSKRHVSRLVPQDCV